MKLISVNVGVSREVEWHGRRVLTSIWKEAVGGRVMARRTNLDGDRQSDLTVHGGPEKAVYAYPSEHYPFWRNELGEIELPWGSFGENLTTDGIVESETMIGDRLAIGSAELMITQPRSPCFKLGIRFGRDDMVRRFIHSGRSGFYLSVVREGEIGSGDRVEFISRDPHRLSVADVARLYARESTDPELLRRAVEVEALPDGWREYFRNRLNAIER